MRRTKSLARTFLLSAFLAPCLLAAALCTMWSAFELSNVRAAAPLPPAAVFAPAPSGTSEGPRLPSLGAPAELTQRRARIHLLVSLASLLFLVFCSLVFACVWHGRAYGSFRRLEKSFRTAAAERRPMDVTTIEFDEFRQLAEHANSMVRAMDSADEQLRASEEKLRQSQKMDAVGRLVGGIAHDFNNLLTAIMGYADLITGDGKLPADSRESMKEIQSAAHRAGALTRQLLAFSRRQTPEKRLLNLNTIVTGVQKMLARIIGENVSLRTFLDPALCPIQADPSQIEQVIINLVVNARDAIGEGGEIAIETATFNDALGRTVSLCIRDNGIGMNDEVKQHLFEPFYTTKASGKGTGFGLSIVHAIVTQSGGLIGVQSAPGEGTTFTLTFPGIAGDELLENGASGDSVLPSGSETILLVEDDTTVATLAARVLTQAGYRVLSASTGAHAFTLMRENRNRTPSLLVTDIILPDMTGSTMHAKLRADGLPLEVLYISGYSAEEAAVQKILKDGARFLPKPFTASALLTKVRQCIDASG